MPEFTPGDRAPQKGRRFDAGQGIVGTPRRRATPMRALHVRQPGPKFQSPEPDRPASSPRRVSLDRDVLLSQTRTRLRVAQLASGDSSPTALGATVVWERQPLHSGGASVALAGRRGVVDRRPARASARSRGQLGRRIREYHLITLRYQVHIDDLNWGRQLSIRLGPGRLRIELPMVHMSRPSGATCGVPHYLLGFAVFRRGGVVT